MKKAFNAVFGVSVGNVSGNIISSNGDISATTVTVAGLTSLGNVANVKISGGTANLYLRTDGTGNLSWSAVPLSASGSNNQLQFNNNGLLAGSANLLFNTTTNTLSTTNITANGAGLTSLTGANVIGQVANALVAGTVYTNAQPNITSLGTLTNLIVSGNITSNNISGTLTTAIQPNITSLGTLGNLSVSGNANVGNINLTGNIVDSGPISVITGSNGNITLSPNGTGITIVNSALTAVGNIAAGNISGTLTTAIQPNITSLGTLSSLSVSGTANIGAVANVKISGGANTQVLTTNGTGNLYWGPGQESGPAFTYTSGVPTRIDYDSGSYKILSYTLGVLTRIDYVVGNATTRKDFVYNPDGTLASINQTNL